MAENVNERLFDRIVAARIGLIKHEHATARKIRMIFNDVRRETLGYLAGLPEYRLPRYASQYRLEVGRQVNLYLNRGGQSSLLAIREAMEEAARKEDRALLWAFQKEVPLDAQRLGLTFYAVPEEALIAIMDQEILGDFTQSIRAYSGKFNADVASAVDRAMGASVVYGEGIPEISRRIRDIVGRQGHALTMFSRTAIQTAGYRAQQLFYEQNRDVIKKQEYMATFDTRTCPICAGYDGRRYNLGEGPHIPIHVGCRCTYTPVTKSYRELGLPIDELSIGSRRGLDGKGAEPISLEGWIRKKAKTKEGMEQLRKNWGPTRAKLFTQGKVDLADMVIYRRGAERFVPVATLRKKAS